MTDDTPDALRSQRPLHAEPSGAWLAADVGHGARPVRTRASLASMALRPRALRFASCQAPNATPFAQAVAQALGRTIGMPVDYVDGMPWQQREQMLYEGEVHVAWLCGLPYVREADRSEPRIELLAAPVMRPARYGGRPVYFTDLMLRRDRPARCLADLRGASVAINEPNSHSGYEVLRHALAERGLPHGFFREVVESGAHQRSLELIESGDVDVAPIDTTVFETEVRARPQLGASLRAVATLGPSPMPPWVASTRLAPALRSRIRQALLMLGDDPRVGEALARANVEGFAAVNDDWYAPIRQMSRSAARYPLPVTRAA